MNTTKLTFIMARQTNDDRSPLEILGGHFQALERKEINVPGLPIKLYAPPLNFEQSLTLGHAVTEKKPMMQARAYAGLIAKVIQTEDGKPAFTASKGGHVVDEILTNIPATCMVAIIEQLADGTEEAAKELEALCHKKK